MERKSLMDGISSGPAKGAGKGKKEGRISGNTLKLGIAITLLVIAAGVITIYLGLVPTPLTREEVPPAPTAEQKKAVQQQQQHNEELIKQGHVTTGSS
jgi:hypothetical protein